MKSAGLLDSIPGTSWRQIISSLQGLTLYRIEDCFRVLQKYSLVKRNIDQQSYAMYMLVHA
jgi:hypothetical protein